jgi:hypothetical protein
LGRKGKWEYFRVIYGRYGKADCKAKREMLRILPDHGLPPKIRHTHIEWPSPREGTRSAGTEAWAELWARTAERPDQRMGGGWISLVGAVESAAADLDALDPQALQVKRSDRETTALDQSAADGPSPGRQEEPTEAADLRAHQAGLLVEAYDGDNLVEETNSSGAVVARYEDTQNIDEPLAMFVRVRRATSMPTVSAPLLHSAMLQDR